MYTLLNTYLTGTKKYLSNKANFNKNIYFMKADILFCTSSFLITRNN